MTQDAQRALCGVVQVVRLISGGRMIRVCERKPGHRGDHEENGYAWSEEVEDARP